MLTAADRVSVTTANYRGKSRRDCFASLAMTVRVASLRGAQRRSNLAERRLQYRLLFDRVEFLPRVLDHRDRRDLDVGELAVDLLGAADIDVLHDVAGCRI